MRSYITLLLLAILVVLISVVIAQPQNDNAATIPSPQSIGLPPTTPTPIVAPADANLDIAATSLTDIQQSNSTFLNLTADASNSTATANTTDSAADANAALLDSLDTSHLTANQRSAIITTELNRMELVADQPLSLIERERLATTMDAWLQLSPEEKLAMIRQQQAAYMRAIRMEERRRLRELMRGADELRGTRVNAIVADPDDGSVRRVRLVRVQPVHATTTTADLAAQQMDMPYAFDIQQMDQHYQAW